MQYLGEIGKRTRTPDTLIWLLPITSSGGYQQGGIANEEKKI
jgi:hypothetical protein